MEENPQVGDGIEGLIKALNYVIPQINRTPNVNDYSPIQWTMGYIPHIPGMLMEERSMSNPAVLDPTQQFMEKLQLIQAAMVATTSADTDQRLRRALLRRYMGQHVMLNTGDRCFYWRDGPQTLGAKIKWRGPATVIMREASSIGPHGDIYWIAHGTVLLRAAPEHVKPATMTTIDKDNNKDSDEALDRAKGALQNIRNRGVTQYVDLKRKREEIDTDEETEEYDDQGDGLQPEEGQLQDRWQASEDGRLWTRIHNQPRRMLYVPELSEDVPVHLFKNERVTNIRRGGPDPEHIRLRDAWKGQDGPRTMTYTWTGSTTFMVNTDMVDQDEDLRDLFAHPGNSPDNHQDDDMGPPEEEPPTSDPSPQPTPPSQQQDQDNNNNDQPSTGLEEPGTLPSASLLHSPEQHGAASALDVPLPDSPMSSVHEPEPLEEPAAPSVPEHQKKLYASNADETFEQRRLRTDQQETLSFKTPGRYGPSRTTSTRSTPYGKEDDKETVEFTVDHSLLAAEHLPDGWKIEKGYIVLGDTKNEWRFDGNYLTKKHYLPRDQAFIPTEANCPIPLRYLRKDRYTVAGGSLIRDKWTRPSKNKKLEGAYWTGHTRFKVHTCWKDEARKTFYQKSQGNETVYLAEARDLQQACQREVHDHGGQAGFHDSQAEGARKFLPQWSMGI